jgi:hypothetical protein
MKILFIVQTVAMSLFLSACGKSQNRTQRPSTATQTPVKKVNPPVSDSATLVSNPPQITTTATPPAVTPAAAAANSNSAANAATNGDSKSTSQTQTLENEHTSRDKNDIKLPDSLTGSSKKTVGASAQQVNPQQQANSNSGDIKLASDSNDIKNKKGIMKISFKDLAGLVKLSQDQSNVLLNGKLIPYQEGMKHVQEGNEESFCQVKGAEKFHKDDFLKLTDLSINQIDKNEDINQGSFTYSNANGNLIMTCTLLTEHLFFEDVRTNFSQYLTMYDGQDRTENDKDYINPLTEDRELKAIQILDLDAFTKIYAGSKNEEYYSFMHGKPVKMGPAFLDVDAGKEPITCSVSNTFGKMTMDKIFMRISRECSRDKLRTDLKGGTCADFYQADGETAFILNCEIGFKAPVDAFRDMGQNLFKFGVLDRKAYKQKAEELVQIRKDLKEPLGDKK